MALPFGNICVTKASVNNIRITNLQTGPILCKISGWFPAEMSNYTACGWVHSTGYLPFPFTPPPLFSSPGNFHQMCQQGSCIQGVGTLTLCSSGWQRKETLMMDSLKQQKNLHLTPNETSKTPHNWGQAGLSPPMAEQLAQQDISIFIFNTRKPAVNVLMDTEMNQGKRKPTEMCVCSFSNTCTVI